MYKLSDWLDIDKIGWFCLSKNINAITILFEEKERAILSIIAKPLK